MIVKGIFLGAGVQAIITSIFLYTGVIEVSIGQQITNAIFLVLFSILYKGEDK